MSELDRKNLRRLFVNPSPWPEPPPETDEEDQPPPPLSEELVAQLLADMERAHPARRPGVLKWLRAAVRAMLAAARPPSSG